MRKYLVFLTLFLFNLTASAKDYPISTLSDNNLDIVNTKLKTLIKESKNSSKKIDLILKVLVMIDYLDYCSNNNSIKNCQKSEVYLSSIKNNNIPSILELIKSKPENSTIKHEAILIDSILFRIKKLESNDKKLEKCRLDLSYCKNNKNFATTKGTGGGSKVLVDEDKNKQQDK